MQHRYSSENSLGGLWLTTGRTARIYCSWWWDTRKRTLYVRRGKVTCTWAATEATPVVVRKVLLDLLPEIARGMGQQIAQMEG